MDTTGQAVILGLIQGITEWLPISSSGHLTLIQHIFTFEGGLAFDAFLHGASLAVILIFFRQDIYRTFMALVRFRRGTPEFTTAIAVVIATAITAVFGLFFEKAGTALFTHPAVVGTGYLISTSLLFLSRGNGFRRMNGWRAVILGIIQSIALIPGVSRSGSTIAGAKLLGISGEEAFTFSFLLAVPAIAGALILEARRLQSVAPGAITAGFLTAFTVSFPALLFLRKTVISDRFHLFGWYCLMMAVISFTVALT